MGGSDVFNSQGRIHNKAGSTHIDTRVHIRGPLPGHFALKRAKKLMRVQSFITLETEREREAGGENGREWKRGRERQREGGSEEERECERARREIERERKRQRRMEREAEKKGNRG